jgi:hypothetical protein
MRIVNYVFSMKSPILEKARPISDKINRIHLIMEHVPADVQWAISIAPGSLTGPDDS